MNPRKLFKPLLFICMFIPGIAASEVTEEDFMVKTTKNLINLCTVSTDDPHYKEAIEFCRGYLVGAYHYYAAQHGDEKAKQLVCLPEPNPTRYVVIEKIISWAQQHPEFMNELPVETEFRALTELWPCKK